MYNTCGLLFLSFGFTMLKIISCYSGGAQLESECQEMNINHGVPQQNTEAPYKIKPEYINVTDSELGTNITVTLLADPAHFRGFMLDARKSEKYKSAGWFNLTDPVNNVLVCGDRAVAQRNNLRKTRVEVLWTPEETGVFFFRAAFVKQFNMIWPRKPILMSTAAPTTEATSHSTQTSPTDTSQTVPPTSEVTVGPTPPPQCTQYTRCALALLLFSRLCFLGGCSLLMIIRPVLKMATMIVSVIELASKTIAVIFILIKLIQYDCECECDSLQIAFTALTVTAMVSSILHTLTIFLHCGPSHELRKCWLCALIMVDLMNTLNTTTAIFFGIWCFKELWLPVLMGVYVIWEFMLYLGSVCFEKMEKYQSRGKLRKNLNHISEKRISPWSFMFSIFLVFNVMFTAALMTGVSLVKMENC
ncbi:uncharacterized protein LOC131546287 isoform X2 [Onychostoma macrolepis]|uniref:uncharacterized protein LOC131546287 isoform X2 n=1 Tax=Onychostoma macrolepis TaxID=369639 RepID=UPI00272D3BCC|nr:uncharacterized protein LOC131546287 isoform X2 [Onychostoma macrolepis]